MRKAIDYLVEQAIIKIDRYESYDDELEALEELYLYSMHSLIESKIDELKEHEYAVKNTFGYFIHAVKCDFIDLVMMRNRL